MSCKCAVPTDQYHGWECEVTGGECMFLFPDSKACARKYGEGPDADTIEEEGCHMLETKTKTCRECNKLFVLTPDEQQSFIDKGLHEPTRCEDCRQKRRNVEILRCVDCGHDFEFNQIEQEFYQRMGFDKPRRCIVCRKARRNGKGVAK